jgi:superfamily II DNA or RNA helicase
MSFCLRPYQQKLADDTIAEMLAGGAPCLVAPTGAGKTVILSEIVRYWRRRGYKVVLAAHRNEIIKQIAASVGKHLKEPVGFYTASRVTQDRDVVVTMIPTLARRKQAAASFAGRVLLLDEAHHCSSKSYQEIIRLMAPIAFAGATATPVTPTGAGLGRHGITKLILGPQPKELMDSGALCKYRLFGAGDAVVDTAGLRTIAGDYNKKDLEERVVQVSGDFLRDLLRFNPDLKPTITVTVSIEHANQIAEEYSRRGVSARVVIGTCSQRERENAFEQFANGSLKVIVTVALIEEGVDIPAATCLQLIRPTKSLRLWKQLIGRVLRPSPQDPSKVALIIDHGNTWKELPLPCESIDWSLEGKTKTPKPRRELNDDNEVVERPPVERALVAKGDRQQLKELSIESLYQQRIQKRVKAVKKNLYLVEAKGFNPAILWPWANNPEGLDDGQLRRIERALGLPYGHCNPPVSVFR